MALLMLVAPAVRAVELTASNITFAFRDDAGRVTHRLNAKRGTSSGDTHHLQGVEIVYFSAKEPDVIVQRLEAAEATWDEMKETLSGRDRVRVATEQTQVTGRGFDFALATSVLNIHRDFTLENRELNLASDRAVVELLVARSRDQVKVRDIKRCEAIGNLRITVQPNATQKYPFEKAYSDVAIYDGAAQTITLPRPTRYEKAGRPAGGAQTMVIEVGEKKQ